MRSKYSLLGGIGLGATSAYLFDPLRGSKRRSYLRDQLVHGYKKALRTAPQTARDLSHRTHGLVARHRPHLRGNHPEDTVLVARVRSTLGRYASHPHSIEVTAQEGMVTLRGPVPHHEADRIVEQVKRVRGVRSLDDEMERHKRVEHVSGLQGGSPRSGQRIDLLQRNWAPATRFLVSSLGTGAVLTGFGLLSRPGLPRISGLALTLAGGLATWRAVSNQEIRQLLGLHGYAVRVRKTINIDAPVETVFNYWACFENFPKFMHDVKEVRTSRDNCGSHWVVRGPAGVKVSWDAVLTQLEPNQLLAWRSVPGSVIPNAGRAKFIDLGNGRTRVDLDFFYNPPAGALGNFAAMLFGSDAKSKLDQSLAEMKNLIELGPSERQARRFGAVFWAGKNIS